MSTLFIFILDFFPKQKKTSLNGIEKCLPAKSNSRDGQGKSDK